jgi:predicted YcjX-like family ATPase
MVYQTKHQLNYDEIDMKTLAIASVKATKAGKGKHQGQDIPVIQGLRQSDHKLITLFPGAVPPKLPAKEYWQDNHFNYHGFSPLESVEKHESLPHLRMDQVLEFLLGDKIK